MTEHMLIIEPDPAYPEGSVEPGDPEHIWRIECSDPDTCDGWIECNQPHEVDGVSAENGPYDVDGSEPWADCDDFEFHGQQHQWLDGFDWCVDHPGCVLKGHPEVEVPDELQPLRPGRWPVKAYWEDDRCTLSVLHKTVR